MTLAAAALRADRLRAIAIMMAGVACLATNDAIAKWLVVRYDPDQLVLVRSAIAAPVIAAVILWRDGPAGLWTARPLVHLGRGVLVLVATIMFFLSLRALPLAEATSIIFSAPIFVTALSGPVLGEWVGPRRWAATLLGFASVLVIVRPGAEAFQPASLLALGAAVVYAVLLLSARRIDPREGVRTVMLYVVFVPGLLATYTLGRDWPAPQPLDLPLFVGLAAVSALSLPLISEAFRRAPAAVVAPFDYTILIWATLFGWAIWGSVPDGWTLLGAAGIVTSGLIVIWREARAG